MGYLLYNGFASGMVKVRKKNEVKTEELDHTGPETE